MQIIGVMPPSLDFPLLWENAQFWRPVGLAPEQRDRRHHRLFRLLGRLRPGRDVAGLNAELAPLARTQQHLHPEAYTQFRYHVRPLHETLAGATTRLTAWMLLALSGMVLVIACANLANLQLVRAARNVRELAIRSALGASRWQLLLLQLQESLLLSLTGGMLGLALTPAFNAIISRQFSLGTTAGTVVAMDGMVLAAALLVSLLSGTLFGLAPAWLASTSNLNTALRSQARGSTAGRGHRRLRRLLITAEIALVFVLLSGAGMMQGGFARFARHDNGWDTAHVLTGAVGLSETRFETLEDRAVYFRQLLARLEVLPGVEKVALATSLPIHGYNNLRPVMREDRGAADVEHLPVTFQVLVTRDYFAAMGIPLQSGTTFPPESPAEGPPVAIVNETLAQRLWPGESAVGRRLATVEGGNLLWHEVIGVARDVNDAAALRPPETPYTLYRPLLPQPWPWANIVLRSRVPAAQAIPLRRAAADLDPDIPVDLVATVPETIAESQRDLRRAGNGLIVFAGLGLAMAAAGMYGVIASFVTQRTSEFGIRLALGARPADIRTLVLRDGAELTALGLLLGLGGTLALFRLLSAWMPRLVTLDWLTFVLVALFLSLVAVVACLVPARRATRVDPLIALRAD